jgi:hypothetical protein
MDLQMGIALEPGIPIVTPRQHHRPISRRKNHLVTTGE